MAAFEQAIRGRLSGTAAFAAERARSTRFDLGRFFRASLALEVERRRLFPWIAVAFGSGILLFFAAEGRPWLWAPLAGAVACGTAAFALRARPIGLAIAVALAAIFLGFAAAAVRVWTVEAPRLNRTAILKISGFVESVEERQQGARLVVLVHTLGDLGPESRPARVRVSVRRSVRLSPGDFLTASARLLPPPEPARPGGYDFGRDAFFRGLGGVGSLIGKVETGPALVPRPLSLAMAAAIDGARNSLTRRMADSIGGQPGAVAAALVTGKRGLIADETNTILRAAGIYHVVSISGLHMVLAAGVVFWLVRALLALVPSIALQWPIKKIAASFAMVAATAYCVFSGLDIAAERSLVMTLVMLGATLVDRPALSIRNLAVSALIVLAREPEGLLGPSFQMSYGAVAALIAATGAINARFSRGEGRGPWLRAAAWLAGSIVGMFVTTLVATLATAPFSTYHFQNLNPYGLIGNAVTLPLVSIVIMPAAVIGVIAYPFGLDGPVWWVMGLAVKAMLAVSQWVSGFDHATVIVPAYGAGALALFVVALILLTLPASGLRWFGLVPTVLGLVLATLARPYDLYLDRDGSGAVIRGTSGRLVLVGRAPAFVVEQWLKAEGDARSPRDPTLRDGSRCDPLGCVVEAAGGEVVAYVADRRAFEEDCRRATIVITRLSAPAHCRAAVVVDRAALTANGATALRWSGSAPEVAGARKPGETRPWIRPAQGPTAPAGGAAAPTDETSSPPRAQEPNRDAAAPSSDEPG